MINKHVGKVKQVLWICEESNLTLGRLILIYIRAKSAYPTGHSQEPLCKTEMFRKKVWRGEPPHRTDKYTRALSVGTSYEPQRM